jgi:diaminohydroxyphosphoribosylaminopyrimidine deaminase/5-amino-6-(5-phosphoribosylamino)uracil reductase
VSRATSRRWSTRRSSERRAYTPSGEEARTLEQTRESAEDLCWQRLLDAARDPAAPAPYRVDAAVDAAAGGTDARVATLLSLYRPLFDAPADDALIVGHLGQSLDGFIATESGDSRFVTGPDNIVHLHRMRALCDAVIVGAGTVAADDPQLTTREVPGPNPLRVVLDPRRRLDAARRLFTDRAAPTLLVHAAQVAPEAPRDVETLALRVGPAGLDLAALVAALRARGCRRLFVEGGACTVAGFLQAGLLSRLQIAVAPLLIGAGRPTIRLPGSLSLSDCLRARHRVFRMGTDVLFDLDLAQRRDGGTPCVETRGLQQVV